MADPAAAPPGVAHEQAPPGAAHDESPRAAGPRALVREAILSAALELLAEQGYDRLSMDAIAERAHSSKATIYRHWSGKAEVVAEAVRCRACETVVVPSTGALRSDLLAWLESMGASVADDGTLITAVAWAMRSDPVLAELMRAQMTENKEQVVAAIVEAAVGRGDLAAGTDPHALLEVVNPMVLMRLVFYGEPLDRDFFVHLVDDVALPLLQSPPRN